MDFYPVNLNLKNKKILIVGAGKVAFRKFKRLAAVGALIKIVSPEFDDLFSDFLIDESEKFEFHKREFDEEDLKNIFMVFAATNQRQLNAQIAFLAKEKNILVNIADDSDESDFILPALVNQGKLMLTISTASTLPALSKKIRKELENNFALEYQLLLEIMTEKRKYIIENIEDEELRQKIFRKTVSDEFLSEIRKIIYKNQSRINKNYNLSSENYKSIISEINEHLLELIQNMKEKSSF